LHKNTAPGNKRKESDSGTSSSRGLVFRDCAPAPQGDLFRQGFRPCSSFWVEEVTLFFRHRHNLLIGFRL
jgi:hypothetical protein